MFDLLDAVTDMGRELPELENDPVARALGLVGDDGQREPPTTTPQRAPVAAPVGGGRRRSRWRGASGRRWALAGVAAAVALVVLAVAPGGVLRNTTPAAAVHVGQLTSECTTTFRGGGDQAGGDRHVVVAAVWGREERDRFREVLDRFSERTGISVSFATDSAEADRDMARTLKTLREKGCPPDVALLPQPGLLADLADTGALIPVDGIVAKELKRNYSPAWRRLGEVDERSYGIWFKAANKSIIWYNQNAFRRAGIAAPPSDWRGLKEVAKRLHDAGITPFAVGGGGEDGWVLTDWFENVYLAIAGAPNYDKLARGEIAWTDPSVKRALATLAEVFATPGWVADRRAGGEGIDLRGAVEKVFGAPRDPEAAMVFEGDFVASLVAATPSRIGVDARFFSFPSIERSEGTVVPAVTSARPGETGGDVAVLMTPTDAGKRLLRFLATPEAAEPWVKRGGFISPNKQVDLEDYPDEDSERAARELVSAAEVRFDLSDQLDPEFGGRPEAGMWKILQGFLADPGDIDGTAQRLEDAARAAQLRP